ncbi:hypothetical protein D9O36_12930 [Zobellia amurskyensis]|uniref:Heme-binding HmuY-like protein n=1 Tax=Zobellia amurskyensis TaxID=248905 RepID=A0A7X3D253_9FLAO|nr:hypothetical protein [Zobellia amurskyensis]MUH36751.1 hypothetical protein [Zobellia amurskyensis]
MKKKVRSVVKSGFAVFALAFMVSSCSSDEGSVFDTPTDPGQENPEDPTVATLIINGTDDSNDVLTAEASGEVGTTVPGRIIYTSTTNQKRLYITQNISGGGEMPFNNFNIEGKDLTKALKGDGSVDLDGDTQKAIDFTFDLPVPDIDNGEIVYQFWTTTGKGDFRDPTKRKALGVGAITVTVGDGKNADAEVRSFTDIKLFAPDENGTTETFFSLLNGSAYRIDKGPEFRAFWDFGYYYGASGDSANDKASFASTATYNDVFPFDVKGLEAENTEENAATETLNHTYFDLSSTTTAEFDAITSADDLNFITKTTFESRTNLEVGEVIEFVDNYDKKGLIKITEIKAGYGIKDYIVFDVKIQP